MAPGILNVNKPLGLSSFAVVRMLRRLPGVRRAGHGGTLDPAADGVLPILIDAATRLNEFVHEWPKTYLATVTFGFTSDTYDREGTLQPAGDPSRLTAQRIEAALPAYIGSIEQVPPMYSALKVGGEPLYRRARRGETVERPARAVDVRSIRLLQYDAERATARLEVSSGRGMYVRSLAHDLGAALGCGAYLAALTRLAVGPLRVEEASAPADLLAEGERWANRLLPIELPVLGWPALQLDVAEARAIVHGRAIDAPAGAAGRYRLIDADGRLLALGVVDDDHRVRPQSVFGS